MSAIDRMQPHGQSGYADRLLIDAAHAAEGGRLRIAAVIEDLTAPREAIAVETRIDLARLLAAMIAVVEDDLRQRLIEQLRSDASPILLESLGAWDVAIAAPILDHAGALGDYELIAALLRRIEMRRTADRLRLAEAPEQPLLEALMQSGDEPLAGLAMAVLTARSGRYDAADDAPRGSTDLPAELQYRLVWRVAAALRHYLVANGGMPPAAMDRAVVAAATGALAGYDEDDTLEGRALQVARRLHQRRRLDDALILRAIGEGEIEMAVAALAVRAGIDFPAAWDMAGDGEGSRLTLLLRAIGVHRGAAAGMLRALVGSARVAALIDAFDLLDPLVARGGLLPWQADPGYRRAMAELAGAQPGLAR